jgi:hemolysin activation/secretion protein
MFGLQQGVHITMSQPASAGLAIVLITILGIGVAAAAGEASQTRGFVLPAVPPGMGASTSPTGPRFILRRVDVTGNTILPQAAIAEITAPFLGHEIGSADLEELRYRLTQAYVERGYINSGAILPDQQIQDGVVTYRMIEGRLVDIEVTGTQWLSPQYVRNRLTGLSEPVNIHDIEERIQLLLQDPTILRMNVELVPGPVPGQARLLANVTESNLYSLGATIANNEPPNVGSVHGQLNGVLRNLTGWGDRLAMYYGRTQGVNEGGFAWTFPLTPEGAAVTVSWDYNGAGVVSEEFRDLNIRSVTATYGVAVSVPLYRTATRALTLTADLERRSNDTFLLGEPFSFAPGFVNGHARASIARLSLDWTDRRADQVVALRSTVSHGLGILGATNPGQPPNADFTAWLGQAQYVHSLPGSSQIIGRAAAQLSSAPLLPFEQVAIGGMNTVRGYRQNALVRDNAVLLSLEGRIPLFDLSLPTAGFREWSGPIQLAPFLDYGTGWNTQSPTPKPRALAGMGIGLRWDVQDVLSAQIYYGHGLAPVHQPDHDLQDDGIYFRVTASFL